MTERALRDELEALHAAILQERARLAAPAHEELSQTRAALQAEIATLTERLTTAVSQRTAREEKTRLRREETKAARQELAEARAEIGDRQPLGDPLAESRSNWEDPKAGCGIAMLVMLSFVTAAGWWLS